MSNTSLTFRPDIQGLRAIAITLVVLAHAGLPGFAGGFVGVDVFFVLSGYLITGLLIREYKDSGHVDFVAFFARRLKRLLPALVVMLTLVSLLATVLLSDHEFSEQTASVGYAATWTSNLYFAFTTFDYFSELHDRDLFLHTWSLGVEEQFYIAWPALGIVVLMLAKRCRVCSQRYLGLSWLLAVLFAGSFGLSVYWSYNNSLWAFYLMPARVWQFALGAGVYVWFDLQVRDSRSGPQHILSMYARVAGVIGFLLILASAILLRPGAIYPGFWALFPSVGAALIIAGGVVDPQRGIGWLLARPAAVWFGNRSYSWYLWHWPLLMLGFAWGLKGNPTATAALISLAMMIAGLSYRFVELPFWKGRFSLSPPLRTFGIASLGILITSTVLVQMSLAHRDSDERGAEVARSAREDMPAVYRMGCDTWFTDATVKPCVMGNPEAPNTAVLLGDSIGAQWFSLLPGVFAQDKWRFFLFTKSSCAMVDESYRYGPDGVYRVCAEWRNRVLNELEVLQPDVVFVGSAATYGFSDKQWIAGTRRVLDHLTKAAGRIVVIPGTPSLSFNGPGCVERWLARNEYGAMTTEPICSEMGRGMRASHVHGLLMEAAAPYHNADILPLGELVCPDGRCAAISDGGVVVFRDQQHLTDSFVRAQIPQIKQMLRNLGFGVLLRDVIPSA